MNPKVEVLGFRKSTRKVNTSFLFFLVSSHLPLRPMRGPGRREEKSSTDRPSSLFLKSPTVDRGSEVVRQVGGGAMTSESGGNEGEIQGHNWFWEKSGVLRF